MPGNKVADFFIRERNRLLAYTRRLFGDSADIDGEDLLQDLMVSFLGDPEAGDSVENLSAYVYRSIRNRVTDAFRRRKPVSSLDAPRSEDGASIGDTVADHRPGGVEILEEREQNAALQEAIASLSEEEAELIEANALEGKTFEELSEEWDVPIGTLLARKHRAMEKLRRMMMSVETIDQGVKYE